MDPIALVIFIAVVLAVLLCVLYDVKITIPKTSITITVDYAIPPLIGVFLLYVTGVLTSRLILQGGLLGDERIQPFAIMIIFNGLAYLCIAIDMTGLLAFIALKVAQRAGSSAFRLFSYFFLLSAIFTVFTSNDIVILTLTPIIYYCSQATNINPMPFLFAEFLAANICSLVLLIGNPTNIIVGEANHLTFADYSMWMVVPAFVATATAFVGLYALFRQDMNQTFVPPELDPQSAFKDKRAALFHSTVLLTTLLLLSIAPWIGASLWVICAVAAGTVFLYNVFSWPWTAEGTPFVPNASSKLPISPTKIKNSYQSLESSEPPALVNGSGAVPAKNGSNASDWLVSVDGTKEKLLKGGEGGELVKSDSVMPGLEGSSLNVNGDQPKGIFGDNAPPSIKKSLLALPYRIVPFVFGMFVLVEGLYVSGWIDAIAETIISAIPAGSGPYSVFVSCFLLTAVTLLLCNLINNQPATILLTRVIIAEKFMNLPSNVRSVGMFAVILGSNLGANFTLIGALAGIMWAKILADKNLRMTYLDFAKVGFKIMPFVTIASAGVLFAEHIRT